MHSSNLILRMSFSEKPVATFPGHALARQLSIDAAVASGQAKIEGNVHILRKLLTLFELATGR